MVGPWAAAARNLQEHPRWIGRNRDDHDGNHSRGTSMNRREFAKMMGVSAAALSGLPLGITRAVGQTKGGTLNTIIQPEPPILVTALNQQQPTLTLGGKIYESLLRYGFDLKPLPGLAQSWDISPDGMTYTFKLFPNITFHDGHPLTSEDVVFSMTKLLMDTHARARTTFARIE